MRQGPSLAAALLLAGWRCLTPPIAAALSVKLRGVQEGPLITGCLDECGGQDQNCVTECQVCVEENRCERLVSNCSICLREVHAARRRFKAAGNEVMDSGGVPLRHEGVRQRLQWARLQVLFAGRQLRRARIGVLQALRQVEWAREEIRADVVKVKQARRELEKKEEQVRKWEAESEQKLQQLRRREDRLKQDVIRTKRQLARARREAAEKRRALDEAKGQDAIHSRAATSSERAVQRLEWKLRMFRAHLYRARKERKAQEKNAGWLRRGMRREVRETTQEMKEKVQELKEARNSENKSRVALHLAKERYKRANDHSRNWTEEAAALKRELELHPLPVYDPAKDEYLGAPPVSGEPRREAQN